MWSFLINTKVKSTTILRRQFVDNNSLLGISLQDDSPRQCSKFGGHFLGILTDQALPNFSTKIICNTIWARFKYFYIRYKRLSFPAVKLTDVELSGGELPPENCRRRKPTKNSCDSTKIVGVRTVVQRVTAHRRVAH